MGADESGLKFEEAQRRACLLEAFAANMVLKPFKWEGQVVILLELKVNNVVAKVVYNPGCTRIALS